MNVNATGEDTQRFQRQIERKKREILDLEKEVLERREKVRCPRKVHHRRLWIQNLFGGGHSIRSGNTQS